MCDKQHQLESGMKPSTLLLAAVVLVFGNSISIAQKSAELDKKVSAAMSQLTSSTPAAAQLAKTAKGILMFPSVKKAGFIVGGQYGEGALRVNRATLGYFKTTAASFGLQAGGEKFGYAMFFMNDSALDYLKSSNGWEIGVGPSVTVVDAGAAASLSTSTARSDIYVFFFGQKGLMGGLTIQGSKITKFENIDK
jgi:lipid-binding SYLF domain-containing protein